MYFWNTKALAEDIKNGNLTENDWKNYYLAGSIFVTLSMYLMVLSPRENGTSVLIEAILMIGILIFGISTTFNSHQANSNKVSDYIATMAALSFPIIIKLFLLSFAVGFVMGVLGGAGLIDGYPQEWFMLVMAVAVQGLVFWRLNFHIKVINAE